MSVLPQRDIITWGLQQYHVLLTALCNRPRLQLPKRRYSSKIKWYYTDRLETGLLWDRERKNKFATRKFKARCSVWSNYGKRGPVLTCWLIGNDRPCARARCAAVVEAFIWQGWRLRWGVYSCCLPIGAPFFKKINTSSLLLPTPTSITLSYWYLPPIIIRTHVHVTRSRCFRAPWQPPRVLIGDSEW